MQYVWYEKVKDFIKNNPDVYDPRKIIYSGKDAMNKFIEDKINILNCEK